MDFKSLIRPGRGAADIAPLLADATAFRALVEALSAPFIAAEVAKVACVEGRGFLLGAPVAFHLSAGIAMLRFAGRLKTRQPVFASDFVDYAGTHKRLEIAADAIVAGQRVLLVDDWTETGATLRAAIGLIERCGGVVVGVSVLMDDTAPPTRAFLHRYAFHSAAATAPGDQF